MQPRQARAQITLALGHLRSLDLDPPKALVDGLATIDRWADVDAALTVDRRQLATAVADAHAAGRDVAVDKGVTPLLARQTLASADLGPIVATLADERRAALLTATADEVVAILAAEVARLDTTLRAARETVGPRLTRALSDPATAATALPAPHLSAWGQARDAVLRLGTAAKCWRTLGAAVGRAHVPANHPDLVSITAAVDAPTLSRVVRDHGPDATAPAIAGVRLELATFEEHAERVAEIAKQRAEQRSSDQQQQPKPKRTAAA
jgi:hypothetical protein